MRLTRRNILLGSLAGGIALGASSLLTRRIDDEIYRILHNNFGDRIANAPDAALFVAQAAEQWSDLNTARNQILRPTFWRLSTISPRARGERQSLESNVINAFLRATNAVRAYETGTEELQFLGMPNPYRSACANPLSSAWL